MEDILKFMQWDSLHLDGVIILLVISSGFWSKKYLETVNIVPAWKTLIVSFIFTSLYVILLIISNNFRVEKIVDYFISFAIATSLYDLLLKPLIKKFFPNANLLILVIGGSFLFAGCNSVKRVLKDDAKLEKVGREWEKKNPCVNDTVKLVKSDTIVTVDTVYNIVTDSIIVDGKTTTIITKVPYSVTKTIRIKDTINNYIVDNRRLYIALDSIDHYKKQLAFREKLLYEQSIKTKEERGRGNKWLTYFIVLAILTVVTHILRSKFKI